MYIFANKTKYNIKYKQNGERSRWLHSRAHSWKRALDDNSRALMYREINYRSNKNILWEAIAAQRDIKLIVKNPRSDRVKLSSISYISSFFSTYQKEKIDGKTPLTPRMDRRGSFPTGKRENVARERCARTSLRPSTKYFRNSFDTKRGKYNN